ncbi:MAG: raffinose/stachyose/melibiose transport system permease protein [Thermotogaceae bacterium]|jgi:raffinose/stachyose/melibiose transport system permease protein|nr:raffinose/stachyose/melibiose transport system permease protein [Thermotogaceae bacterium]MDN5338030.1 raffinose/stachyose/melibiose transport system permease protein [Thermotogaceae bacterium]
MIRLNRFQKTIVYIILLIYCLIIFTPFSIIFFNSFKNLREIFLKPFSLPSSFSFRNYTLAWEKANLGTAYVNSFIVTLFSVVSILIVSSLIAYALSRYSFPFRRFIYLFIISGLALPARLAIIPIYTMMRELKLTNSLLGLIVIYTATGIPFSVFILKHFMDMVPKEIEESALMDGATPWKIFSRIVLPLSRPALVVVTIVNFVAVWNDFFYPLILINDRSKETVPLAITVFFGEFSQQWHLISTALWIAVFPIIIIFFALSRYFISGMTQGAIK